MKKSKEKIIKAYVYLINDEMFTNSSGLGQIIPFDSKMPTAWRSRSGKKDKYGKLIQLVPCEVRLMKTPSITKEKIIKTTEQAIRDKILYIGNEIPESLMSDKRPKFIVLGTPQEFIDETSEPSKLNKDFYNNLPSMVCEQLEGSIIPKYGKEEWFEKAWEEYRQHIKNSTMDTMKMPGFIFKRYINPNKI